MELESSSIKLPQPEELTKREKEDAMGSYLMMFAAVGMGLPIPIVSLIASVIYYYINRKKSKFAAFHSLQSLITQIPVTIFNTTLVVWLIMELLKSTRDWDQLIYFAIFTGVLNLIYFTFSIIGAVKAKRGQMYYFLFFGRIAFARTYNRQEKDISISNQPPKGF